MAGLKGLLFDKDGTLFDFVATWGNWTKRLVKELAHHGASPEKLADAIGFDLVNGTFAAESPVIAHTPPEIADHLLPLLPRTTKAALVDRMNELSAGAELAEAVPLRPLFDSFRARGLKLGLVTNDTEIPARAHLSSVGILPYFDFVAGCDSGFGAKPLPGPLLAFASRTGLDPSEVAMVGDSRHDLVAGRAAGMTTIGVLTGPARAADLAPYADAVLQDIGHLPAWLDRTAAPVEA